MAEKLKKSYIRKGKIAAFFLGVFLTLALSSVPYIEKVFYPYPFRDIIERNASVFGLEPLFVAAVIREESRFNPESESHKGAKGLMQLMPATARSIAVTLSDAAYKEEQLFDPEKNIYYGTWYLADLQKVFAGNNVLALTAYNGGRGHVQEWINKGTIDPEKMRIEDIPFSETRIYVERVLKSYEKYKKLYK